MKIKLFLLFFICFICVSCTSYTPNFDYLTDNDVKVCSLIEANEGIKNYGFNDIFDENQDYDNEYLLIVVDVYLIQESITTELMMNLYTYLNSCDDKVFVSFGNVTNTSVSLKPFKISKQLESSTVTIYSNFYKSPKQSSLFNSAIEEKNIFGYRVLESCTSYIKEYKESI